MDILMTGYVAVGGISCILNYYENELNKVLPGSLINSVKKVISDYKDTAWIPEKIQDSGYDAIVYKAGEGGIYKALWDVAEEYGIHGLSVNLKDMTIKQEFIEISEYFNINPYMLNAEGSYIIVSEHGNSICRYLQDEGIVCAVIGYTTENNDRVIVNNEEIRYINSRIKDELTKLEGLDNERKDS